MTEPEQLPQAPTLEHEPRLPLSPASSTAIIEHAVKRALDARGRATASSAFDAESQRTLRVREPPASFIEPGILSEHYYKIRRSYALFAGILSSWTLIGLTLSPTPFQSFDITILRPEMFPVAIVLLVFYFGSRYWLHWSQITSSLGRAPQPFRTDYFATHVLAFVAVGSWALYQLGSLELSYLVIVPQALVAVGLLGWFLWTRVEDFFERTLVFAFVMSLFLAGLLFQAFNDVVISTVGVCITGFIIGAFAYKLFVAAAGLEKYSVRKQLDIWFKQQNESEIAYIGAWNRKQDSWLGRLRDRLR